MVYPSGIVFKRIVTAFKGIVDQIPIVFSSDNFVIEALSPDKVTMVFFEIPSTSFEEYTVTGNISLVADRDDYIKAVRRASKRDKVVFEYLEGSRELKVKVIDIRSNVEREYSVTLNEIGFERLGEINISYEVQAALPTSEFIEIIKDSALIGDEIVFTYSSDLNALKITAHGELAEYETILKPFQPLTLLESSINSTIVRYGVEHLKSLSKILDLADECSIAFGPDKPLKISLTIAGGGKIAAWIAPRS